MDKSITYCDGPAWVTGPGGHRALHWLHLNHGGVWGREQFPKRRERLLLEEEERGFQADEIHRYTLWSFYMAFIILTFVDLLLRITD